MDTRQNNELDIWTAAVRDRMTARFDEAEQGRLARLARLTADGESAKSQRAGPLIGVRTWLGHTLMHVGLAVAGGQDGYDGRGSADERHHHAGQTV